MIAVSITVIGRGPDRTVEATVADTVPVAELIPHLVTAEPGDLWRLSGPVGVLRPERSLAESEVRPGERLTLQRAGLPAPPVDDVGRLSEDVPPSPAAWVAACLAAVVSWFLPAGAMEQLPELVWHPLGVSATAQTVLDGAVGEFTVPAVPGVPVVVLLIWAAQLVATFAAAAASLTDARYVPVAALLGFGVGLQVSVVAACLFAALAVWRPGPERVVSVGLLIAAVLNVVPGVTMLLGLAALTFSGQLALGLAGVRLPRIPATGLFDALESSPDSRPDTGATAARARSLHPALVVTCCVVLLAGTVQLLPAGESDVPVWTIAALLVVALTGLSARACRPVHSVVVTVTATLLLTWVALHLPGAWSLLALAPAALPAVRVTSPLAGRVLDITETIAFAVAIPLLIATTGIFDLVRGIG